MDVADDGELVVVLMMPLLLAHRRALAPPAYSSGGRWLRSGSSSPTYYDYCTHLATSTPVVTMG